MLFNLSILIVFSLVLFSGEMFAQKMPKPRPNPQMSQTCQANALSKEEVAELTSAHNMVRSELRLEPLSWDCKLATSAQKWADKATTSHDEFTPSGESIFVASSPSQSVSSAVVRWMSERPNWDNKSGRCSPGKVCSHYTQIVWKATRKIGCGVNRAGNSKWKVFLVCHYDPAGNSGGPAY